MPNSQTTNSSGQQQANFDDGRCDHRRTQGDATLFIFRAFRPTLQSPALFVMMIDLNGNPQLPDHPSYAVAHLHMYIQVSTK